MISRILNILCAIGLALMPICVAVGCRSASSKSVQAMGEHNAAVHKQADAIKADSTQIANFLNDASGRLSALIAWYTSSDAVPTTQQAVEALRPVQKDVDGAAKVNAGVPAKADAASASADQQKAEAEKAIAAAVDKQKQKDDRTVKWVVALGLGVIAMLLWERFTKTTFLIGAGVGLIAFGLTYFLFGELVLMLTEVFRVAFWFVFWGALVAVAIGAGFYVYKRYKAGGWAGLMKNVELQAQAVKGGLSSSMLLPETWLHPADVAAQSVPISTSATLANPAPPPVQQA